MRETVELVQDALLIGFAVVVMTTDWRSHRIPNVVTYPAMLIGLVLAAVQSFPGAFVEGGLIDHAIALVAAFVLTYPLYATGGLKAGDVKLLMAVGALEGSAFLLGTAIFGAILGGAFAIGFIGIRRLQRHPMRDILRSFIPYGVALGLGALVELARHRVGG